MVHLKIFLVSTSQRDSIRRRFSCLYKTLSPSTPVIFNVWASGPSVSVSTAAAAPESGGRTPSTRLNPEASAAGGNEVRFSISNMELVTSNSPPSSSNHQRRHRGRPNRTPSRKLQPTGLFPVTFPCRYQSRASAG
ncbi:hypothetical protein Salat_1485500 [Sesamum alatum]|uniref:Uncharacterized protein n=1 Tax=Sesamum alatum TaxID=300844 RepID=A0AAE1YBE4_9LAMI|nr:hypothetical protein Salat_1485500 [Sesamum alatum]